jgi:exonuclease III
MTPNLKIKMINSNNKNILQWNCDGLYSHLPEFQLLLQKYNPFVICLQETKFKIDKVYEMKNFNLYYENVNSDTIAHGGVAIYVNKSVSSSLINLNCPFQAVAVRIFYPLKFIICCIYLPDDVQVSLRDLNNLIEQFDCPFLLMGDINGHNILWGSKSNDRRGKVNFYMQLIIVSHIKVLAL